MLQNSRSVTLTCNAYHSRLMPRVLRGTDSGFLRLLPAADYVNSKSERKKKKQFGMRARGDPRVTCLHLASRCIRTQRALKPRDTGSTFRALSKSTRQTISDHRIWTAINDFLYLKTFFVPQKNLLPGKFLFRTKRISWQFFLLTKSYSSIRDKKKYFFLFFFYSSPRLVKIRIWIRRKFKCKADWKDEPRRRMMENVWLRKSVLFLYQHSLEDIIEQRTRK